MKSEQVKKIIGELLGVKFGEVKDEYSFENDLGADELDMIELVMAMEEEGSLKEEISEQDAAEWITVKDVVDYMEGRK